MNHRPFIHVNQLFNKMLALIPSNQVAGWLLIHIHRLLDLIGLEKDKTAEEVIYIIIVAGIAICLGWIIRTRQGTRAAQSADTLQPHNPSAGNAPAAAIRIYRRLAAAHRRVQNSACLHHHCGLPGHLLGNIFRLAAFR